MGKEIENRCKYQSNVIMSNDRYKDITMITYAKYVAFIQVITVLFGLFYVYQVIEGSDYQLLCMNSGLLLVIAAIMFLSLKRSKIDSFEKSFRQEDGTPVEYVTCFYDDKIEVKLSNGVTAEYGYANVKAVKEAENLYFIEMPKDFHIVVNKEMECNQKENDFSKFILEKCLRMREKRVINITKEERSFKEVILILAVAFVISIVLYNVK